MSDPIDLTMQEVDKKAEFGPGVGRGALSGPVWLGPALSRVVVARQLAPA